MNAVPWDPIDDCERIARDAAAAWREHGALSVAECVADDVPYGELSSFPRAVQAGRYETVIYSWIVTSPCEARNEANAKVMAGPRIKEAMTRCRSTRSG